MDAVLVNSALLQDHSDFNSPSPHSNFFDGSPNPGSPYDAFDFAADGTFPILPLITAHTRTPQNPSGISITDEYNPSEYDVPNSSGPYALDHGFMNALDQHHPHVSVSVTPPLFDNNSPSAFDQGSPASSNGAEDDVHSHASSTSSYMQSSSPRLDFTQNFQDRLSFHSPNWAAGPLPDDRTSPPLHKPPSPLSS
ncbi:hypothetical protein A0H81_13734 [Grifola frondosa]|uniref:Uncharacterized protein n=1 Tax=Grifola frondosa TaxID=5627 RepID=A0A1C7LQD0_GRIFR|nr:hypothetical protein A0H81_13734 [Grifola frondosa]